MRKQKLLILCGGVILVLFFISLAVNAAEEKVVRTNISVLPVLPR